MTDPVRRSGFSFVEMLVVVAVIAVLFGLVFSGASVIRNRSDIGFNERLILRTHSKCACLT